MKRMTDNTRPVPGPSASRDASQGGNKGGSKRRSRRRRGGKSGQGGGNQTSQSTKNNQNNQGDQSSQNSQSDHDSAQEPRKNSRNRNRRRGGQNRNNNRNNNRNTSRNKNRNNHRGTNHRRKPQYAQEHDSNIETRDETSAGGLVVSGMAEAVGADGKVDMSRIYVALIGRLDRRGRLLWSMPKGHVEDGEHQWKTAEREVWEETGITGEAFDTLGVIDYWFVSDGVRIHKTVHHNLLRYVDGVFNDEDPEVTEVTWVPMSELMEHLAYADERKLARIACDRMPDLARKEANEGRATPR